jgi:hypothetical protein
VASVPDICIKDKPVDYDREILSILGHGYKVGDYHFRPPSLGVWSLWEILDSPVIKDIENATLGDYWLFLYVNHARKDCVDHIAEWLDAGKPNINEDIPFIQRCRLHREVFKFANKLPSVTVDFLAGVHKQLSICFQGFEMLPDSGPSLHNVYYIYAGEAYGSLFATNSGNADTLIWEYPISLIGHIYAAKYSQASGKGISRPKDKEDMQKVFTEADEREAKGELHDWQIKAPLAFPLSPVQCQFPELIKQYQQLKDEALEKITGTKTPVGETENAKN